MRERATKETLGAAASTMLGVLVRYLPWCINHPDRTGTYRIELRFPASYGRRRGGAFKSPRRWRPAHAPCVYCSECAKRERVHMRARDGYDPDLQRMGSIECGMAVRRLIAAGVLASLTLAGCDVTQVDRRQISESVDPPTRYVVEQDEPTPPGASDVEAVARCDAGDQVLAGGCAWGDVVDAHDQPLRPLEDAPAAAGDGWVCRGQNTGVGAELKTLRATAVCEAR